MHKYLKKLIISTASILSVYFVSLGFVNYLSLDWKVEMGLRPVASIFHKFKHIKYPLIFSIIKNKNQLSDSAKALKKNIKKQESRILKIYANASSLFYLDYLPIDPIEKKFKPIDPIELASMLDLKAPGYAEIFDHAEGLSLTTSFPEQRFKIKTQILATNWSSFYEELGIEAEILSYVDFFNDKSIEEKDEEDLIKLVQSSTKRASKEIKKEKGEDLVFFSYQEKEQKDEGAISSAVMKAIEREIKKKKGNRLASTRTRTVGGYPVTTPEKEREEVETKYKAKLDLLETEVITIGVRIDEKVLDQVSGIEFVPHYNKNERIYDESEGVIRLTGNLEESNYIYGTLLGKDYINMRTSIPLFLGGGIFEVPLIEKESMNKLLDKENLKGMGSYLLVDLGDSAIDVDIDKTFEARTFLTDRFKVTTQEGEYKYILYVGVESGNTVIRYLDSKGGTYEKLTFLADSELTFEFFSVTNPYTFKFETFELSPLSKKTKELALSSREVRLFGTTSTPKQVGINSFKFNEFSGVKSSNSYLEFSHLGNSIFAGMRFSDYVILPSSSFIDSILRAEGLGSLDNHCMIQLNLSQKVKNILYDGEDRVGPMEIKLHYLDEDGVLSEEASLLTKHAFLFGSGQGVINMQIEFLNGTKLNAQSFCSEGTYLVEQL